MIRDVKDLSPEQRTAVESLLGRRVSEQETVSVQAFEQPDLSPTDAKRSLKNCASILPRWMQIACPLPLLTPTKSLPRRCGAVGRVTLHTREDRPRYNDPGSCYRKSSRTRPPTVATILAGPHQLVLCNEIVYEVARVLRYPRLRALHGLPERRIYDYIGFLRG